MINLEPLAALAAAKMSVQEPENAERVITKALMVLAEQGLVAFGLFLATRHRAQDTQNAENIHRAVKDLLNQAALAPKTSENGMADYYRALTQSFPGEVEVAALQRILLTKQLVETALTYGRYHAKALAQ